MEWILSEEGLDTEGHLIRPEGSHGSVPRQSAQVLQRGDASDHRSFENDVRMHVSSVV